MLSKIFKSSLCKTPRALDKLNSANTGPEDLISQRYKVFFKSNFQFFSVSSVPGCTKRITVKISCFFSKEQTLLRELAELVEPLECYGNHSRCRVFLIFRKVQKNSAAKESHGDTGEGVNVSVQSKSHESLQKQLTLEVQKSGEH